MFSTRTLTFLALLFTFGMFALASPVDTASLVARDSSIAANEAAIVARVIDPAKSLVDVLTKLKADVAAKVALLDGVKTGPILDIVNIVNAAVKVCAGLGVAVNVKADVVASILNLLVNIINTIVGGLAKYNVVAILSVLLQVDACLSALIKAILKIIPGLLGGFTKNLINVDLFLKLKLTLCLAALGLGKL